MYELKNVKTLQGREGYAWTATLYNGKTRVAYVRNDGNGGMTSIDWVDGRGNYVSSHGMEGIAMQAAFARWVRDNCARSWIAEFIDGKNDSGAAELGVDMMFDEAMATKEYQRKSKTAVVFRLPEDGAGQYRFVKHGAGQRDAAIAYVVREMPTAQVWSTVSKNWEAAS